MNKYHEMPPNGHCSKNEIILLQIIYSPLIFRRRTSQGFTVKRINNNWGKLDNQCIS